MENVEATVKDTFALILLETSALYKLFTYLLTFEQ